MNKFVDDKGLKRYTDNMKLLLKKKVSKKMKSQVIIGRAIKPRACEIGGMENWYAFAGEPSINLPKGVVGVEKVYVKFTENINYSLLNKYTYKKNDNVIQLVSSSRYTCAKENSMYRVDKYEINETNQLSIWLTSKDNAKIQRGTVSWMEINQGKKYDLRKIMTPEIITYLIGNLKTNVIPEGVSRTVYARIVLKRFGLRYKNTKVRDLYPSGDKRLMKLKWGKLKFVFDNGKPGGPNRLKKMCGKYRIRLLNKINAYMPPITFFIKGNGDIVI